MGSMKPVRQGSGNGNGNGNRNPSEAVRQKHNPVVMGLLRAAEIWYGLLFLTLFTIRMLLSGKEFQSMDAVDKKELADARDRLWNLQKRPFGLLHRFCKLRDGTRLHYVLSLPEKVVEGRTGLVIFLHGFPDSWHVWHPLLKRANLKENATLVAVDLPGYGGSDGVAHYGPDTVLDVVSEFIIHMRESYLSTSEISRGPVIVVGHDWGCVIASRLAAEAPVLADRFIVSNAFPPAVARANIVSRFNSAQRMLKTWANSPTNFRPLRQAFANIKPVLVQLLMSGYVFAYRLPWPLNLILGELGDFWLLRVLNAFTMSSRPKEPLTGAYGWDMLASSVGPGPSEIRPQKQNDYIDDSDSEHLAYASPLKKRAKSGGWRTKIRLYQDGLVSQKWQKSMHLLWELNQLEALALKPFTNAGSTSRRRSGSRVGLFDTGPEGAFGAATTIIWGEKDVACHQSIALEGVGDYFSVRGSQLITLPRAGHWPMYSVPGVDVFEAMLHWALTGEQGSVAEVLQRYADVKLAIER